MKKIIKFLSVVLSVLMLACLFAGCGDDEDTFTTDTDKNNYSSGSEDTSSAQLSEGFTSEYTKTATAVIEIKDYGTIKVELDGNKAPITVENFVKLAKSGFYDGLTFHRIMEGFMMQGGDPQGTGMGGSDENIKGEFKANGVDNNLSHIRGAISMARATPPDSASSQFFIVHKDSLFLDGNYAVFGYVTEGMEIVDKVCTDAKPTDDNGTIPAAEQPIITKITIEE